MNNYMYEAITKTVKENMKRDDFFAEYQKGFKLIKVEAYTNNVDHNKKYLVDDVSVAGGRGCMMVLLATFKFSAPKGENNRVKFQINVYSDGTIQAYYEGDFYEA